MSQDRSYYMARAIEERRLAMASTDLRARRAHLELAAEYALKARPFGATANDWRSSDSQEASG